MPGNARSKAVDPCTALRGLMEPPHALIEAVHTAFAEHYPLVLPPDDVWLCLAQGFAQHVEANAEALRSRFVRHRRARPSREDRRSTRDPRKPETSRASSRPFSRIKASIGQLDLVVLGTAPPAKTQHKVVSWWMSSNVVEPPLPPALTEPPPVIRKVIWSIFLLYLPVTTVTNCPDPTRTDLSSRPPDPPCVLVVSPFWSKYVVDSLSTRSPILIKIRVIRVRFAM